MWPPQQLPRGRDGCHTPTHLRQAFRVLALHGQRPAPIVSSIPFEMAWEEPLCGDQSQELPDTHNSLAECL
jgi:hypothetical protein